MITFKKKGNQGFKPLKQNCGGMSTLASLVEASSSSLFESKFVKWCDEAEKTKDIEAISLILTHPSTISSAFPGNFQSKLNNLAATLVVHAEQDASAVTISAIQRVIFIHPSRFLKLYSRLGIFLRDNVAQSSQIALCYASLPSILSERQAEQQWKETFDFFVASLSNALTQRDEKTFENVATGLISFLEGTGRVAETEFEVHPTPILKICRDAVDINQSFSRISLLILKMLCHRTGRTSLSWAGIGCDIVELSFELAETDNIQFRGLCYSTCETLILKWKLGVGSRLGTNFLLKAIKVDWRIQTDEIILLPSINVISTFFLSGAATLLQKKSRVELDEYILELSLKYSLDSSKSPEFREKLINLLNLASQTFVEGTINSHIKQLTSNVFKKILSKPGENENVLLKAKIALNAFTKHSKHLNIPYQVVTHTDVLKTFVPSTSSNQEAPSEEEKTYRAKEVTDYNESYSSSQDMEDKELAISKLPTTIEVVESLKQAEVITSSTTRNLHISRPKRTKFHDEEEEDDSDIPDIN